MSALTVRRPLALPARPSPRARALLASQGLALLWWAVALWLRSLDVIPVWHDQSITFARPYDLAHPYHVQTFVHPPWAAPIFSLFGLLPLPVATLIQTGLLFATLTLVIHKYGGGMRATLLTLTSFVAFDATLELNVEWIVYVGLLVPPAWSGLFLLVKPQAAFGYWLGIDGRSRTRALVVLLAALLASVLVWGLWPARVLTHIEQNIMPSAFHTFNMAPLGLLPAPLSVGIGAVLAYRAWRRQDPVLGLFAWLFFVPYILFYSLTLALALVAVRWPRAALVVSVAMWLAYGGILAWFLATRAPV